MNRRIAVALPTAGAATLCECLDAVLAQEDVDLDVLVIENAPAATDACRCCPERPLTVERPGCNLGVATSWNLACEWAFGQGHDAVLLLNDDVVLAGRQTLARVRAAADSKRDALLLLAGCGFSAMYLLRTVFEAAGPFDSGFWPAYFEDVDMHRRLMLAGIEVDNVDAEVTHAGSATIRGDAALADLVGATFPRNRERYRAKWGGLPTQETFTEPWAGWKRGGPRVVVAVPTVPERADTCAEVVELYRERSPVPVDVVTSTAPGGWCAGLNDVWRRRPGADVFVCGSDDMVPEDGWLGPLLVHILDGALPAPCVIDPRWTNYGGFEQPVPDGTPSPRCTFPVLSGEWLDEIFPLPEDLHYFGDDLIRERLGRIGVPCVAAPSSLVHHRWDQRGRGAGAGSEAARMEIDAPRYLRELARQAPFQRPAAPRLTVVIPTRGRPTLRRTLESLTLQLSPRDEVLVVGDGPQPVAREICADFQGRGWSYLEHELTGDSGNSQREAGIARGTGSFLCLIDDDDAYTPDAFAAIRQAVTTVPDHPHMFRMDNYGSILWRSPDLEYGNVGTPMFVARYDRPRLGHWDADDFSFISRTVELQGEPVWHEAVVAVVRPHLRDGLPV